MNMMISYQELVRTFPKFPAYRDVNGFNFAESMANEALIRQLI